MQYLGDNEIPLLFLHLPLAPIKDILIVELLENLTHVVIREVVLVLMHLIKVENLLKLNLS